MITTPDPIDPADPVWIVAVHGLGEVVATVPAFDGLTLPVALALEDAVSLRVQATAPGRVASSFVPISAPARRRRPGLPMDLTVNPDRVIAWYRPDDETRQAYQALVAGLVTPTRIAAPPGRAH